MLPEIKYNKFKFLNILFQLTFILFQEMKLFLWSKF